MCLLTTFRINSKIIKILVLKFYKWGRSMKILIWAVSLFVFALVNTIIGETTGFRAGSLVLVLLVSGVARWLCKKYDEKNGE